MSVFLDANILLEVLLPGRQKAALADRYVQNEAVVSPLSAHLYAYFGTKEGFSIETLTKQLALLNYTELGDDEVRWAIANCQDDDFEDALQVACAVISGSELFVTLDNPLAQKYQKFIKIKVL
jgi:predicted nucleic acid-binding protein